MKVILLGSTGMIGQGVLIEALKDTRIESILLINRQTAGVNHPKLTEIIHRDFYDIKPIKVQLSGYDTCLFCLGVSSVGMKEADYSKVTFELTTYIAKELLNLNPTLTFCYISGANTDSTENGKAMWARVKGKTENALLAMNFKHAYMFRPGFIQPMKGIKSKTPLYKLIYDIFKPFYFLLKSYENIVTNTEILGKAMIIAAADVYEKTILESIDINEIVKRSI